MQISLRRTVLKDDAKHLRKVPPTPKNILSARCNFKLTNVISSSKIILWGRVTFCLIFGRYAIMMHLTEGRCSSGGKKPFVEIFISFHPFSLSRPPWNESCVKITYLKLSKGFLILNQHCCWPHYYKTRATMGTEPIKTRLISLMHLTLTQCFKINTKVTSKLWKIMRLFRMVFVHCGLSAVALKIDFIWKFRVTMVTLLENRKKMPCPICQY